MANYGRFLGMLPDAVRGRPVLNVESIPSVSNRGVRMRLRERVMSETPIGNAANSVIGRSLRSDASKGAGWMLSPCRTGAGVAGNEPVQAMSVG